MISISRVRTLIEFHMRVSAVRLGDGPQRLLVLGRYDGEMLDWISAEREVIVTRRGRVVRTYGLPEDLKETVFLTADPVGRPSGAVAGSQECLRALDLEPGHRDGVVVSLRFEKLRDETLDILGERVVTELWQERGTARISIGSSPIFTGSSRALAMSGRAANGHPGAAADRDYRLSPRRLRRAERTGG